MRRAGILLHPSSLPGPYGIGDIGPSAREWLTWLEAAGQRVWQFLPLHPVDVHGSPYASPSAFAWNPLLISIDDLVTDGWLTHAERPLAHNSDRRVDFEQVRAVKRPALEIAAARIAETVDLAAFSADNAWLEDWALYAVLSILHGPDWTTWPEPLRNRTSKALAAVAKEHHAALQIERGLQWAFTQQWTRLRTDAAAKGIALWGDLPFLVAHWSCDVWVNPGLFRLDAAGQPTVVSGVPPDVFSPTGQRWGHPLYLNEAHAAEDYAWWRERSAHLMAHVDAARLDHFRGIEGTWEIPAEDPDATGGQWIPGLGRGLLDALREELGSVPIIAEDLGIITPEVEALRDDFELPGMAILQFAFGGDASHAFLPHNHRPRQVVYTGTHDNDTVRGWYDSAAPEEADLARRYLSCGGSDIAWDLIRAGGRSVAETAIVPLQDVLSLGNDARMNLPGEESGNWGWRMSRGAMNLALARRLRAEASVTGRLSS